MRQCSRLFVVLFSGLVGTAAIAQTPLGSDFKYQGELVSNGSPATGQFDLVFDHQDADSQPEHQVGPVVRGMLDGLRLYAGEVRQQSRHLAEDVLVGDHVDLNRLFDPVVNVAILVNFSLGGQKRGRSFEGYLTGFHRQAVRRH